MRFATWMLCGCCAIVLSLFAISPAYSGPLNGDGLAILSGTTPFTGPVVDGKQLLGTVDYAVYTYAAFQAEWGGLGYVPTLGEDVYTYQVIIDGALPVSHLSVHVENPADNPGAFALGGGQAPSTFSIGPGGPTSSDWFFAPEAPVLTSGLAFSSPYAPIPRFGSLVDGGTTAFVIPLPTPGSNPIPEPATVTLVLAAAIFALPMAVRRFRRR